VNTGIGTPAEKATSPAAPGLPAKRVEAPPTGVGDASDRSESYFSAVSPRNALLRSVCGLTGRPSRIGPLISDSW
jgi:hypothetical protein